LKTMTKERRRTITRLLANRYGLGESLRIEQFMEHLRQEVEHVREEQPELSDYQLFDLTFSFAENGLMLHMEFRR
jgi:hypothetical protein